MTVRLKGEEDLKNMTFGEKVKFYASLCLGTTALLSVFAFLFLIPFVIDPSITTILANFDATPVICKTVQHIYTEGLSNCTWASCREGCTLATTRCHQIYINYSHMSYDKYIQEKIKITDIEWKIGPVKFFVNTEGCGYPPRINCTEFAKEYGRNRNKEIFPCYYSKRYPKDRSVAQFDWNDTLKNLMLAIVIPNVLFGLSIGILSYWYCWPNSSYDCRTNVLSTATYATFDSEDTAASIEITDNRKINKYQDKRRRRILNTNDNNKEWNTLLNYKYVDEQMHTRDDHESDNEEMKRR